MLEYAGRLGLTGPLGINYGCSSGEGAALVRDLMESLHRRGSQQWDLPRIWTALTWFDGFLQATDVVLAISPLTSPWGQGQVSVRRANSPRSLLAD